MLKYYVYSYNADTQSLAVVSLFIIPHAGAPSATYSTIDPSSSLIISSTNMPQNGLQYTIYIALAVGGALLLVIILVVVIILFACCVIHYKRKKNASK